MRNLVSLVIGLLTVLGCTSAEPAAAESKPVLTCPEWAEVVSAVPPPDLPLTLAVRIGIARLRRPWLVRNKRTGTEMVLIPAEPAPGWPAAGGDPGKPFYLARLETSYGPYRRVIPDATQSLHPGETSDASHPVALCSAPDAERFCEAFGVRLPTLAEWRRACMLARQPGDDTPQVSTRLSRPFGNVLDQTYDSERPDDSRHGDDILFEFRDGFGGVSAPCGTFPPDGAGLFDMIGNVNEIVRDPPPGYCPFDTRGNFVRPSKQVYFVVGSSATGPTRLCDCSATEPLEAEATYQWLGFRFARDP